MSDINDINTRIADNSQYSAYINNNKNIKNSRWNSIEHYEYIAQKLNGLTYDIELGWKNIITGTSCNEPFSAKFTPLKTFSAPSFSGNSTDSDGSYMQAPGAGVYGIDNVAKANYGIDGAIPTYQSYKYDAIEPNIYIPRTLYGLDASHGYSAMRLPDSWLYDDKLSTFKHNYPSISSLVTDNTIRDVQVHKTYSYSGTDEIKITNKNSKNITIIFDADEANLKMNILLKFARSVANGTKFNLAVHYKGSKVANSVIDDYSWPKLVICDDSSLLNVEGVRDQKGMFQSIASHGSIWGIFDIVNGDGINAYNAMIGVNSVLDINGVYGCIGRQPLIYDNENMTLADKWGTINNSNKFKNVVSYYIKLVKHEESMIITSIVMSCNGGEALVK